jgi:molecular chaperone DnaK
VASSGDLRLGGIDWNEYLETAICERFIADFGSDPRQDPRSRQALALEIETTKRSLSVRPRAALTVQHDSHRKTYQVQQQKFAELTSPLVERTATITQNMLADNKMGWAHVDVILTTGGASRMPMVRNRLKELGGRTLNTSLSPDQSIAHGATYYAGMLLTNTEFAKAIDNNEVADRLARMKQVSVNARGLGILVQNEQKLRIPHYLIPPNTPLPTKITQTFGTVVDNQKRVHLQIVESPATEGRPHAPLGACIIDDLSPNLPEGAEIAVTIAYDEQARVHVTAVDVTGGQETSIEIIRPENVNATHDDRHSTETETQQPQDDSNGAAESVDDFQIEEWTDSTSAAEVQLPDDDIDILDLTTSDTNQPKPTTRSETRNKPKRRRKPATPKSNTSGDDSKQQPSNRKNLKPPPLPPGLDSVPGTGSGEDEFWNLPES